MTSKDIPPHIGSQESEDGPLQLDLLASLTTSSAGQEVAPANPLAQPENNKVKPTKGTSGQYGSG
jgi:hypothetical protein